MALIPSDELLLSTETHIISTKAVMDYELNAILYVFQCLHGAPR
jgi:hypothetical protein